MGNLALHSKEAFHADDTILQMNQFVLGMIIR